MNFRTKPSRWFAKTGLGFAFVLTISTLQSDVSGQNMILQSNGNQTQMYQQLMSILDQQKERSAHRINAQIDDIHNACTLTEAQRKKLSIAAKGAVNSHSKKIVDQLKKAAKSVAQFEFDPGNPPEPEEDEDAEDKDEDDGVRIIRGGRMISMSAASDGSVEDAKIWTAALSKTLTAQQVEQFNNWNEERRQRVRKSAVAQYVAGVDKQLFLSPEQLRKVTNWIDENVGAQLAAQVNSDQRVRPAFINGVSGRPQVTMNAELKKLLTEAQQEIWKAEFQQSFGQLQNARGVRAIRLQPAIRLQAKLP